MVSTVPAIDTLLAVALFNAPALTAQLWTDHISRRHADRRRGAARLVGPCLSPTYDVAADGSIAITAGAPSTGQTWDSPDG